MFERVKHSWGNLRIFNPYTDTQKKQFSSLRACFQKAFNKSSTDNTPLAADEKTGLPSLNPKELMKCIPETLSFTSPLTPYIGGILSDIETYLNERATKYAQYPNDPTNLFCFQIIQWLEKTLAKATCTKELLDEVNQWIHYIQLIQSEKVFSTAESSDITRTLDAVLINMLNLLDRAKNYIKFEINRATISDYIADTVQKGSEGLNLTFNVIVRILSNLVIPSNFSLINLYNPILRSDLEKILTRTLIGEYYLKLISDTSLQELFFPNQCQFEQVENCLLKNESPADQVLSINDSLNNFLNERGDANGQIVELFRSQKEKILGLQENLAQDDRLMGCFVKTLGLLTTLARVLLNLREASYLAKSGGELLICTLTREQLEYLVTSFNKLVKEILKQLRTIFDITRNSYHLFYKQDKKSSSIEQWIRNYKSTQRIHDQVIEIFKKSQEHTAQISSVIQNIADRMFKTKKLLSNFVNEVNALAASCPWLGTYEIGIAISPQVTAAQQALILPSSTSGRVHKNYQGKRNNNTILDFVEIEIAKDGDCGFLVITLTADKEKISFRTRTEVIQTIIAKATDANVSEKTKELIKGLVAHEIEYALIEGILPLSMQNKASQGLRENYMGNKYFCDATTDLVKLAFKVPQEIIEKGSDAVLNWAQQQKIEEKKQKSIIDEIIEWRKSRSENIQKIRAFCFREDIFKQFLTEYYLQTSSNFSRWVNYLPNKQRSLLDAIAEVTGNNVCIWKLDESENIGFEREYLNSQQPASTVHLLITNHKLGKQCHFNRLVSLDDPLLNVEFDSPLGTTVTVKSILQPSSQLIKTEPVSSVTIEEISSNYDKVPLAFERKLATGSSAEATAKQHAKVFSEVVIEKKAPVKVKKRNYDKTLVEEKIPKLNEDKLLTSMVVLSKNQIACGYEVNWNTIEKAASIVFFPATILKAIVENKTSVRKAIYIWDLEKKEAEYISAYTNSVNSLVALSQGTKLVCDSSSNGIVLDLSGNRLRTLSGAFSGEPKKIIALPKTKGNEKELLAIGGGHRIEIWDVSARQRINELHGSGNFALAVVSEMCIASSGWDDLDEFVSMRAGIQLWNIRTAEVVESLYGPRAYALVSIGNNRLASGCWNGEILIWDLKSRKVLQTLGADNWPIKTLIMFDNHLISGSDYGIVRMWNLHDSTNKVLLNLKGVPIVALAALDQDQLLCGAQDGSIHKITLPAPELVDVEDQEKKPEANNGSSVAPRM